MAEEQSRTLDSLPNEVQELVLYELPLSELLKCGRVSKKWKALIDLMPYHSLTVERENVNKRSNFIAYKYEPIVTKSYLVFNSGDFLEHLHSQTIFRKIRKMTTFFEDIESTFLRDFYNHFEWLEELKIDVPSP